MGEARSPGNPLASALPEQGAGVGGTLRPRCSCPAQTSEDSACSPALNLSQVAGCGQFPSTVGFAHKRGRGGHQGDLSPEALWFPRLWTPWDPESAGLATIPQPLAIPGQSCENSLH